MAKVYLDGDIVDLAEARISVMDRGYLFGDAVYETLRVSRGKMLKPGEYLTRLFESAKAMRIEVPLGRQETYKAIETTIQADGMVNGFARVIVSRGANGIGFDPDGCEKPSLTIIADNIPALPKEKLAQGIEVIIASTRTPAPSAVNSRMRTTNCAARILARFEALNAGAEEAIMLNADGYVTEASDANVFIVKDDVLKTAPLGLGVFGGISRSMVLNMARETRVANEVALLLPHDLFTANECFLSSTVYGLVPVVKIDGRVIGEGRPSMIYKAMDQKHRSLLTG